MAKSKLIRTNEKIARDFTGGFRKTSDAVVGVYKKIENAFVGRYLVRDGESISEAKERITRNINKERL